MIDIDVEYSTILTKINSFFLLREFYFHSYWILCFRFYEVKTQACLFRRILNVVTLKKARKIWHHPACCSSI